MDDISFEKLLSPASDRVIFRGIWGSYAYGTNTPESDRDTIGVFMMERHHYLAIGDPVRQIADTGNDNRFYTLKNYLEHTDLTAGARLHFDMDDRPSTGRGTAESDLPYSFSREGK